MLFSLKCLDPCGRPYGSGLLATIRLLPIHIYIYNMWFVSHMLFYFLGNLRIAHLLDFISIESKVYTLLGQENVNACGRNEREAKCGQGKITGVCADDLNECLDSIVSLVQIAQIERVAP